jgi:hypothetical protein
VAAVCPLSANDGRRAQRRSALIAEPQRATLMFARSHWSSGRQLSGQALWRRCAGTDLAWAGRPGLSLSPSRPAARRARVQRIALVGSPRLVGAEQAPSRALASRAMRKPSLAPGAACKPRRVARPASAPVAQPGPVPTGFGAAAVRRLPIRSAGRREQPDGKLGCAPSAQRRAQLTRREMLVDQRKQAPARPDSANDGSSELDNELDRVCLPNRWLSPTNHDCFRRRVGREGPAIEVR